MSSPRTRLSARSPKSPKPAKSDSPAPPATQALTQRVVLKLPIARIRPNRFQPRQSFAQGPLDELKESIAKNGLLQPPTGWWPSDHEDCELIAGERRLRACVALGYATIDVIILDGVTEHQVLALTLIENLQRQDLTPLDEADGYARMLTFAGMTVGDAADATGKSADYVRARVQLTHLVDEAKGALREKSLRLTSALLIARLVEPDQREILPWATKRDYSGTVPTTAALEREIEHRFFQRLKSAPFDTNDPTLHPDHATRSDDPTLACALCPRRSGASPELFPDLQATDTCTNRACFSAKRSAHVDRVVTVQLERARSENVKLLRVSDRYEPDSKGQGDGETVPLSPRQYMVVRDDNQCDDTSSAVVVDGARAGQVCRVCTNAKCPSHRGANIGGDYSSQERQKRKQLDAERKVLGRILDETLTHLPLETGVALGLDDLRLVADQMMTHLHAERRRVLARSLPLEIKKVKSEYGQSHFDYDGALDDYLNGLQATELLKLLLRIALLDDAWPYFYDTRKPQDLMAVAGRAGIDPQRIRAEVNQAVHVSRRQQKKSPATNSANRQAA